MEEYQLVKPFEALRSPNDSKMANQEELYASSSWLLLSSKKVNRYGRSSTVTYHPPWARREVSREPSVLHPSRTIAAAELPPGRHLAAQHPRKHRQLFWRPSTRISENLGRNVGTGESHIGHNARAARLLGHGRPKNLSSNHGGRGDAGERAVRCDRVRQR